MKIHIASVHEKKKPHKCDICDAMFSTIANLRKHVSAVHEEKTVSKRKPFCNTEFALKGVMEKHVKKHYMMPNNTTVQYAMLSMLIAKT